jgi:hypothetical protein
MTRYPIPALPVTALVVALLAWPPAARAQGASEAETKVLEQIGRCLVARLPPDWREAEMYVTLKKAGAETGEARYTMIRSLSGGQVENFLPCSDKQAAKTLVTEVRKLQAQGKRGWTSARFTVYREGKFDLTFGYPKEP